LPEKWFEFVRYAMKCRTTSPATLVSGQLGTQLGTTVAGVME